MSTERQMTAAEKAEARRQRILAKKRTRMAYAAGDTTRLPSSAEVEEEVVGTAGKGEVEAVAGGGGVTENGRLDGGEEEGVGKFVDRLVGRERKDGPVWRGGEEEVGRGRGGEVFGYGKEWVRVLLVVLVGIAYVVWNVWNGDGRWEVSGVHVFASMEVCLVGARMVREIGGEGDGGGMGAAGMLGLVMRVSKAVGIMRQVWEDFAVFIVCVLGTWYVMGAV